MFLFCHLKNGDELYIRVCFNFFFPFFFVSTQNQPPEIIVEESWVIYPEKIPLRRHSNDTTKFSKKLTVSRKTGLKFLVFRLNSSD